MFAFGSKTEAYFSESGEKVPTKVLGAVRHGSIDSNQEPEGVCLAVEDRSGRKGCHSSSSWYQFSVCSGVIL